jgi:methionine biosynthesis protein MetW
MKNNNKSIDYGYIPKKGERVERASQFVPKCGSLLDIGCGDGILSHFVSDRVEKIYGLDNDDSAMKLAKAKGEIVKKINFDTDRFPYPIAFFDCAVSLDVIEHVYDARKLLSETYRVLNNNGLLIISTPNIRFLPHLYTLLVKKHFPKTTVETIPYDGGHIHFFTYQDLIDLMVEVGFKNVMRSEIINKPTRKWKGQLLELIFGKEFMQEFASPGILLIGTK